MRRGLLLGTGEPIRGGELVSLFGVRGMADVASWWLVWN